MMSFRAASRAGVAPLARFLPAVRRQQMSTALVAEDEPRPITEPRNRGAACLVAEADENGKSRLTHVTHRTPARLLPMHTPSSTTHGVAVCAISSYGGGLLGGDAVELNIDVLHGATLALSTQASTKVYRLRPDGGPAQQDMVARVADDALLLFTPDPLVPFARSAYVGAQRFELSPKASLVAVDWLGSGRASVGERWAFDSYSSRTEIAERGDDGSVSPPGVIEALLLPDGCHARRAASFDIGGVARDATATIMVSGPRTEQVVARLHTATAVVAQRRTGGRGVRDAREGSTPSVLHDEGAATAEAAGDELRRKLLGDLVLGTSEVEMTHAEGGDGRKVVVARLVAEHNEVCVRARPHLASGFNLGECPCLMIGVLPAPVWSSACLVFCLGPIRLLADHR